MLSSSWHKKRQTNHAMYECIDYLVNFFVEQWQSRLQCRRQRNQRYQKRDTGNEAASIGKAYLDNFTSLLFLFHFHSWFHGKNQHVY